eukprot:746239-Hanusia_phi.AAC.15
MGGGGGGRGKILTRGGSQWEGRGGGDQQQGGAGGDEARRDAHEARRAGRQLICAAVDNFVPASEIGCACLSEEGRKGEAGLFALGERKRGRTDRTEDKHVEEQLAQRLRIKRTTEKRGRLAAT